MAHIHYIGPFGHLRAEPNQFILHYRKGRLVRRGAGLAYWFNALSAAVAQVPVEDCETTVVFQERSADFQEVSVQCTLTYRFADPERAAARVNFTISLSSGAWAEQPLQRLATLWSQRAQQPARAYLTGVTVVEAVRSGANVIRAQIFDTLKQDAEIKAMGLELVSVQVNRVMPTPDVDKALQTPTREAIQQKADQATFERRALAVEKERAIKENELSTLIQLAKQQDHLIRQESANSLLQIQNEAEVARERAKGEADASRLRGEALADSDARRVAVWEAASGRVLLGLALQEFAGKVQGIQHLNVSPDLLGASLQQFLRENAEK
jgi:regulator of protease activity HflC (stomatin/prohibitin superfamily)